MLSIALLMFPIIPETYRQMKTFLAGLVINTDHIRSHWKLCDADSRESPSHTYSSDTDMLSLSGCHRDSDTLEY